MDTISKAVGLSAFILCVGLSSAYAAQPQDGTQSSSDRGSQGNQEMIKADATPLSAAYGEPIPKKGQAGKVDQTKAKEGKKQAKGDKKIPKGEATLQNKELEKDLQIAN